MPQPLRVSKAGDFDCILRDDFSSHLVLDTFEIPALRIPRGTGQPHLQVLHAVKGWASFPPALLMYLSSRHAFETRELKIDIPLAFLLTLAQLLYPNLGF